jgi:MFS family permease
MAQWASGYLEGALGIDKIYGDVFGVALFGLMLAIGRTLYSKFGKQPERILFFGAIGSLACYLAAALSPHPIIGLIACAMTGLCSSMLWPGTLIVSAQRIPTGGVLLYALMAAGGDLGASVGPQLVGAVADAAAGMTGLLDKLSMTPDELGLRLGMLVAALFPLAAIFAFRALKKSRNVNKD